MTAPFPAPPLPGAGRPIIRAPVDGVHTPRGVRSRRGRHSPEGFYRDSYNYGALRALLLDPLSPGGSGRYRTAAFDHRADAAVDQPEQLVPPSAILVCDGIFLHRPELRAYWDLSIWLQVSVAVSVLRCAARDGSSPDPDAPENRRYVAGQALYARECDPAGRATFVVDNDDLAAPAIVRRDRAE